MAAFEHIALLASVVIALGITRVLTGSLWSSFSSTYLLSYPSIFGCWYERK
jgi:hypothetical protein